ncbi:MAG: hypothetical protein AAGE96_02395 [Cyanobacteria bacterium P01_G01_bin.19]
MNLANLPISILFFAILYLVGIYSLLTIAQVFGQESTLISRSSSESNNQVKTP